MSTENDDWGGTTLYNTIIKNKEKNHGLIQSEEAWSLVVQLNGHMQSYALQGSYVVEIGALQILSSCQI